MWLETLAQTLYVSSPINISETNLKSRLRLDMLPNSTDILLPETERGKIRRID